MEIIIKPTIDETGKEAAMRGAQLIQEAISDKGIANVIFATGAAQFEMLNNLISMPIDWKAVNGFHLDEYIGLPMDHKASFRKFLKKRLVDKVSPRMFHYINGEVDPHLECDRLNKIILQHPIDVAFVGIGENTHLAFNDPPADFQSEAPYIQVTLDEACRMQQVHEGWFDSLEDVPRNAISMSVKHILKSKHIIAVVPERRKAKAVYRTLHAEIEPAVPASILRRHADTTLYLDIHSASLLNTTDY